MGNNRKKSLRWNIPKFCSISLLRNQLKYSHPRNFEESTRFWKVAKRTIRLEECEMGSSIFEGYLRILMSKASDKNNLSPWTSHWPSEGKTTETHVFATFVLFQEKINFGEEEWFKNLGKHNETRWQELGSVLRSLAIKTSPIFGNMRRAWVRPS
jgi:hypothetical protein